MIEDRGISIILSILFILFLSVICISTDKHTDSNIYDNSISNINNKKNNCYMGNNCMYHKEEKKFSEKYYKEDEEDSMVLWNFVIDSLSNNDEDN